jgi:GNAT superfamily N-acetyltransferase
MNMFYTGTFLDLSLTFISCNMSLSYELQVTETCRGLGMGKWLVEMLEKIAREWSMSKIMLTVLKG